MSFDFPSSLDFSRWHQILTSTLPISNRRRQLNFEVRSIKNASKKIEWPRPWKAAAVGFLIVKHGRSSALDFGNAAHQIHLWSSRNHTLDYTMSAYLVAPKCLSWQARLASNYNQREYTSIKWESKTIDANQWETLRICEYQWESMKLKWESKNIE